MLHFGITGSPLGHSFSPWVHQKLFLAAGVEADYTLLPIPPDAFAGSLPKLLALDGFNITIPHKQAVIPHLRALDDRAKLYGAVNTVYNGVGYNTDCLGFRKALEQGEVPLKGRVVVLGAGGASRVFAYEAALAGAQVVVASRQSSLPKAQNLAEEIVAAVPDASVEAAVIDELSGPFDLLCNGTPVGMHPHPDASPVSMELLQNCAAVFEAVYNPVETRLLKDARAAGSKVVGGMPMLVWQAAMAQEIWFSTRFDPALVNALVPQAEEELSRLFGREDG